MTGIGRNNGLVTAAKQKPLKPIRQQTHFEAVAAKHGLTPEPMPERVARAASVAAVVESVGEIRDEPPLAPIVVPTPAENRLNELQAQIDRLTAAREAAMKAAGIRLLTPEGLSFGDGVVYSLGDVIEAGPFQGKRVMAVSWKGRKVVLDDGTILRMALANDRPADPEADAADDGGGVHAEPGPGARAAVPAGIQRIGATKPGAAASPNVRAAADALRGEYQHPRILQARRNAVGGVNRS